MRVVILGCGTSTGVPMIGCGCAVCTSTDPGNRRSRASIVVEEAGRCVLIDTSTDLRSQALSSGISTVDGVLFTHAHADHVHGIDELRAFNRGSREPIACYGSRETLERIRSLFGYIFNYDADDGWKPNLSTTVVDGPFTLAGLSVTPVEIGHGKSRILGYRIRDLAYLTDCNSIPASSLPLLKGLKLLILGALRHKPHPTHFTIAEAVEASRMIRPARTILTHLSHNVDYSTENAALPDGVELARDGMSIDI